MAYNVVVYNKKTKLDAESVGEADSDI